MDGFDDFSIEVQRPCGDMFLLDFANLEIAIEKAKRFSGDTSLVTILEWDCSKKNTVREWMLWGDNAIPLRATDSKAIH